MKKYICVLPLQQTKKIIYQHGENEKLRYDNETSFPIVPVIFNTAENNESIELYIIKIAETEQGKEISSILMKQLEEELIQIEQQKNISIHYNIVAIQDRQTKKEHLALFNEFIGLLSDNDCIYLDITYGTKPTPIVMFAVLNYAYKTKQNVTIDGIYYSRYQFDENKAYIYDITSIFIMNQIIEKIGETQDEDPDKIIKFLLDISLHD
jgi:hypothetical protein